MEKKSFLIYFDSLPMLEALDDQERGHLFLELIRYAAEVKDHRTGVLAYLEQDRGFSRESWMAFGFMAGNIYRDTMKWLQTQETKAAKKRLAEDKPPATPTLPDRSWGRDLY